MKKALLFTACLSLVGCKAPAPEYSDAMSFSQQGVSLMREAQAAAEGDEKAAKTADAIAAFTSAKLAYEALLEKAPENGLYNNNYGWVLMNLGEFEAAQKYLSIAAAKSQEIARSSAPDNNLKALKTRVAAQ